MSFRIRDQSYGKSRVRLTRVRRLSDRHELTELSVEVLLDGDFNTAYTQGDNSKIVPTDTMKNTVFALGRNWEGSQPEEFGQIVARHFIDSFAHVSSATVNVVQHLWQRIVNDSQPHPYAFVGGSNEKRVCQVMATSQTNQATITSGIEGLFVLKTTESGFSDFLCDRYTTLKPTDDRIFATSIAARWDYLKPVTEFQPLYEGVRTILLREFGARFSPSVQATLYEMGTSVLGSFSELGSIQLTMPNQHRLLVNLEPLGLDNPNLVFVATDEPHGTISATIERGQV